MRANQVFGLVLLITGQVIAVSVRAQGALAEEIWSENFCQEAVSLAKQHGESPATLNQVNCQGLRDYQPSYWQCVIAAMKSNSSMKLDTARRKCLAEY